MTGGKLLVEGICTLTLRSHAYLTLLNSVEYSLLHSLNISEKKNSLFLNVFGDMGHWTFVHELSVR